jgi:hypothetical protein
MVLLLAVSTGCVMDSHDISHLVLGPKRQSIDLDVSHWIKYSFPDDAGTVAIKVPPDFRTFSSNSLPAQAYNARSQRMLLHAEYDYRSRSIEDLAELDIRASYIRFSKPVSTDHLDVDALNRAVRETTGRPPPEEDEPKPGLEAGAGIEWMHSDGTASKFLETTCESYGTLVNPMTVFMLSACYSGQMRLQQDWLDSRRQLLRQVRDQVIITPP